MADTKIRITSNPYTKLLRFDRWDEGWQAIDSSNAPTSGLIKADVLNGFLPFKAKQVVDLIYKEYGGNTTIVFEGPGDEYEDLRSIITEPCYGGELKLICGESDLENASAVLPKIVEVFTKVEPLIDGVIDDREAVESDIAKFVDVSKDQVPLCVIGNYSAGKSTFVNALIGYEILPSGTEAVTAKVFKIKPSKGTTATISFGEGANLQSLTYGPNGILLDESTGNEAFLDMLSAYLNEHCEERNLAAQMNHSIQFINELSPTSDEIGIVIPDLVKIDVPFNPSDPWMGSYNFVIFDTPGSNSETNEDHGRVLREAMEGLSDGLLIFLAMPKTLDTIDNANLCNAAKSIDAMDDRFTMVIVNSADQLWCPLEGFGPKKEQSVRDQTVPRELKPQGIYYISSPVALGAKTNGSFTDDATKWVYNGVRRRFSDPNDEQYTELYRCNILPTHIKSRSCFESEACDNVLLANSGLYCVEREIELFARRYSAYNKCHQAEMLLRRVIEAATIVLQDQKTSLEDERRERQEALSRDKAKITQDIGACARMEEAEAFEEYDEQVLKRLSCDQWFTTMDRLRSKELGFTEESGREHGLDDAESSEREALRSARDNLAARIRDVAKSRSVDHLREAFAETRDDVGRYRRSRTKRNATRRDVDRQAANQLLVYVRESFTKSFEVMTSDIELRSKRYWSERAARVRLALYETATGNTALPEDMRREIGDVIISFQPLALTTDAEAIFVKSELEETLRLLNVVVFESDRLDLRKVHNTYNNRMSTAFERALEEVYEGHTQSFLAWLDNLVAAINSNIESYNPVLEEHVESIRKKSEQIQERERKLGELGGYLGTVSRLISWRERG